MRARRRAEEGAVQGATRAGRGSSDLQVSPQTRLAPLQQDLKREREAQDTLWARTKAKQALVRTGRRFPPRRGFHLPFLSHPPPPRTLGSELMV